MYVFGIILVPFLLAPPTSVQVTGNVHIILPYHPTFYVRTEEDFNITCVSKNVKLLWYRNTKKYGKVDIYAKNGGKFEMIWTEYHPSWKVQSILIRKDAELSDTGTYTCHDHRNMSTYSTKVTVLHIFTTLSNTSFNISCSIAGFSSNLPNITYTWRVNGSYISPNSTAYSMKANDGRMSIQKTNPVREDSANYECVYTFATNIKVINITKSMHFNASAFPPAKGTAAESKMSWIFCWVIAIVIISKIH